MQLLEPENVEMHVMNHHFSEIEMQTISKKNHLKIIHPFKNMSKLYQTKEQVYK